MFTNAKQSSMKLRDKKRRSQSTDMVWLLGGDSSPSHRIYAATTTDMMPYYPGAMMTLWRDSIGYMA